ncbi:MAG: prepilin-type N-terminal cleavage/methylation domain-containing protein, partial [Phycisphaerales bacterium]|nr:prepilin-type N-terminal cleavage/methylation domain-containing protein [Phycisphaerales bacterium]
MTATMATRSGIRAGFSLIELLLAIFILGIGMISVAALFPAGVALQARAEDEINGPLVAADA